MACMPGVISKDRVLIDFLLEQARTKSEMPSIQFRVLQMEKRSIKIGPEIADKSLIGLFTSQNGTRKAAFTESQSKKLIKGLRSTGPEINVYKT